MGHYQAAGKAKDPEKKKAEITLALEHFNKAAEIDPTNMAYVSNRSACYYELKDYDKAIEESQAAVKLGKENQGDFTLMAKAYARIGNAYCAKKMYDEAIKAFDDSLLEEYEKKVEQKRTDIKKIRVKAERAAFMDPAKSEECKAKGNEHFKAGEWHEALKAYSEAIEVRGPL